MHKNAIAEVEKAGVGIEKDDAEEAVEEKKEDKKEDKKDKKMGKVKE